MGKFITHDAVASGWFNVGHSSSSGAVSQWESELENTEEILQLLLDRMIRDYESLAPKMRKAWTSRDLETQLLLVLYAKHAPTVKNTLDLYQTTPGPFYIYAVPATPRSRSNGVFVLSKLVSAPSKELRQQSS